MARLILFSPCERVILAGDQTVSLITLIETLKLEADLSQITETDNTTDVAVPFIWQAVSLWTKEPNDPADLSFEQKLQLEMPDGSIFVEIPLAVKFIDNKQNSRGIFKVFGFPIVKESCVAKLRLLANPQQEWKEVAVFPISLDVPKPLTNK